MPSSKQSFHCAATHWLVFARQQLNRLGSYVGGDARVDVPSSNVFSRVHIARSVTVRLQALCRVRCTATWFRWRLRSAGWIRLLAVVKMCAAL